MLLPKHAIEVNHRFIKVKFIKEYNKKEHLNSLETVYIINI